MSVFAVEPVPCPHCGVEQPHRRHTSANMDRLPHVLDDIADGRFELAPCAACDQPFRTEHPMLLSSHTRRIWIVMHPPADRPRFATIEHGVELVFQKTWPTIPPLIADGMRGVRPRLVFGQHMLAGLARALRAGVDPDLLECAKLLTVRRALPQLMAHGPFELCFEGFADDGAPKMGVHRLKDGARVDGLTLPADILGEARGAMLAFRGLHPELFERPYGSATRVLYRNTAPERV